MRAALLLPLFLLAGCAGAFSPTILATYDADQLKADVSFCSAAGATYVPKASTADIAEQTFEGGMSSLSYLPINPAIPALGAAGAGASALSAAGGLDVTGRQKSNVSRHCLIDRLAIDHAAIIARPEN